MTDCGFSTDTRYRRVCLAVGDSAAIDSFGVEVKDLVPSKRCSDLFEEPDLIPKGKRRAMKS